MHGGLRSLCMPCVGVWFLVLSKNGFEARLQVHGETVEVCISRGCQRPKQGTRKATTGSGVIFYPVVNLQFATNAT